MGKKLGDVRRLSDRPPADGARRLVRIRLDVDAAGAISDCYVARTDQPEFAAPVCKAILKRGRFDPALDAHGQPVRSYRVIGFRFEIE